jgi:type II secretory pathway pseudopilin PulG
MKRLAPVSAPRTRVRAFSAVEVAVAVSIVASTLAVAVPAFVRELHSSRFVEPIRGLDAIATEASSYALTHGSTSSALLAFPRGVKLTPAVPPAGRLASDPPGTWDDPSWQALHFPTKEGGFAFDEGAPHAFGFAFESNLARARSTFVARAQADLDGDGALSTFEVRGSVTPGAGTEVEPGLHVEAPLE